MSKLYLVPTPIGNLGDITLRAIEVLKEVDLVLAEDTRKSGILLKHFQISKPLFSHHKFNEHRTLESLVNRILGGTTIALITDAGTPGISDPGFLLVRACIEQEIPVESLPGPTAFVPALVNSGLPCERFVFEGFLPQKKAGRSGSLSSPLKAEPWYFMNHHTGWSKPWSRWLNILVLKEKDRSQGTDKNSRGDRARKPDRACSTL